MAIDWNHPALAEGLRCYRSEAFFDAHEHWEAVWLQSPEPEKTFLQSLIQIAAAMHHVQRGNRVGAASLLTRALRRLEAYPPEFAGINVAPLRASMRVWLEALQAGETRLLPWPFIR